MRPQIHRMPVLYDFVHDVLFLSAVGPSNHGDGAAALDAALGDPDRPSVLRGVVLDATLSATVMRRTYVEMRDGASDFAKRADAFGGRVALIGESDIAFGVLRIGDAHLQSAGVDSRVFRNAADAAKWLATPRDGPSPR